MGIRPSLFQQCEHTGAPTPFQDSVVWDLVLLSDVQNASEAAHVKSIELFAVVGHATSRTLCHTGGCLPMRLLSSASSERVSEIVEPR